MQRRPSWKRAASVNRPEEKLDLDPWERTLVLSPPAHGLAKGGLKAEEETEDGAMDYSGAYDLARFVRMSHNVAYA